MSNQLAPSNRSHNDSWQQIIDRHHNSRYQRGEELTRTYNTTESDSEKALLEEVRQLRSWVLRLTKELSEANFEILSLRAQLAELERRA